MSADMDRAFIEKNQIVERYLAGKLPFKGKREFEQFCRDHPEVLEELKLSDHLHAGMQLLEESGLPAGWKEQAPPWWRRPEFTFALAGVAFLLLITVWVLAAKVADRGEQIAQLEQRLIDGPLSPPSTTRTIRVVPSRSGPGGKMTVLQVRDPAELVEMRVDVSFARHNLFRLTVDKRNQARAGTLHNVLRDSNGEIRFALNTSGLRAGEYQVAIEGIGPRGTVVPVAWMTVRVVKEAPTAAAKS
jgi:hypothetical protein